MDFKVLCSGAIAGPQTLMLLWRGRNFPLLKYADFLFYKTEMCVNDFIGNL